MILLKAKCQIVVFVVFSLGLGGFVLRAQMPSEAGRRDWASLLPDGEGKGLVLGTCTQCHNPATVVLQRKSALGWETSVRDMISRGAQIQVDEIAPISTYLARSFGPDSPRAVIPNEVAAVSRDIPSSSALNSADALPEGPGKNIVLNSCTSCHVLSKTTEARKDEAGWRGNVRDMVRLGAKLQPGEEVAVVAYLTKHFGRQGSSVAGVSKNSEQRQSSSVMDGMPRGAADPAHLLPDDEGKALILATCVQCHASLNYVLGLRKDSEGWRRSVNDMISRGAQVTPEEAAVITAYLTKHMGREKKAE